MTCIAIDWSGARKPAGKIWIAAATEGSLRRLQPLDSRAHVLRELLQYLRTAEHTVVGLDFAFSFPCWFCREHSACNAAKMWQVVDEEGERGLRECGWPFWGRPGKQKPDLDAHFRRTEEHIGAVNSIKPKSTFQIGGAGAVGTGTIRGIPFLPRLREAGFAVWPFGDPREQMVVEIYPRAVSELALRRRAEQDRVWAPVWRQRTRHRRRWCWDWPSLPKNAKAARPHKQAATPDGGRATNDLILGDE